MKKSRPLWWTYLVLVLSFAGISCSSEQPNQPRSIKNNSADEVESHYRQERAEAGKAAAKPDHQVNLSAGGNRHQYHRINDSDPEFDAIHYRIELEFPSVSPKEQVFSGRVDLTFRPLIDSMQVLKLDAAKLDIKSVQLLGELTDLPFTQNGEVLEIDLGKTYTKDDTLTVRVDYDWGVRPHRGIYFHEWDDAHQGFSVFSQSEPEDSKYWFPGNARPNDKATFESSITVPKPWVAVSNGLLTGNKPVENGDSRTYNWKMKIPMVSYLFVVMISEYDQYEEQWRGKPIQYFAPADKMEDSKLTLGKTMHMLDFYSSKKTFALDYPYGKYAQVFVPKYMWGGMEHTTATTLTDRIIYSPEEGHQFELRADGLVAHELVHQWFGDLLTCKSWEHLWLNEGFATYFDIVYQEERFGKGTMMLSLADEAEWFFGSEEVESKPIVFPYYRSNLDDFFDARNYAKAGWVLHMLRNTLGDEKFYKVVQHYLKKHVNDVVETKDFTLAVTEATGENLDWFFDQWLMRPGYPKFDVEWRRDKRSKKLTLVVSQSQDQLAPGGLAGRTPLYQGPIDVEIDGVTHRIHLKGPQSSRPGGRETFTFDSPTAPAYVKFNAGNWWLARVNMNQSWEAWRAQLSSSKDVAAKVEAALALSRDWKKTPRKAYNALSLCALNEVEAYVRSTCVDAIRLLVERVQSKRTKTSIAIVADAGHLIEKFFSSLKKTTDWRTQVSLARLAGSLPASKAYSVLNQVISDKNSKVKVRAAAVESVGKIGHPQSFQAAVSALMEDSYRDLVRQSALTAMGNLKDPDGMKWGKHFIQNQNAEGTRRGAIRLLTTLGSFLQGAFMQEARLAIEAHLQDASYLVRREAVRALGRLGDPDAVPALERVVREDPVDGMKTEAKEAIAKLKS